MNDNSVTRRDFLRVAAGAVAVATGAACGSGSDKPKGGPVAGGGRANADRTLRIAQWAHFVPAYDRWFDEEYTRTWGEQHGVEVIVDHLSLNELSARANAEVAAGGGHDLFAFIAPPPTFEDQVIDHRDIVEEAQGKLGPLVPLVERSILNRKTGKYFGFADYWVANPVHYRSDLWGQIAGGLRPDSWEDLLRAGPALRAMGHPLGIGMSADVDSGCSLLSLMSAYGSSVQDEVGNVVINSPATVEAVKLGAAMFKAGMTDDIFTWEAPSNNRVLANGTASMILNAVSALRAIETQDPELATKLQLLPSPAGPAGRHGCYVTGIYVVWKFAKNPTAAQQFLVDLAVNYREAFVRSDFYNLPAFPGAVTDLADLVAADKAEPPGKYRLLADADQWSTNVGHPGHANAAEDEVFNQFIIPLMFAAAAREEMSAEDAVKAAEAQIKPIFERWRERGKI